MRYFVKHKHELKARDIVKVNKKEIERLRSLPENSDLEFIPIKRELWGLLSMLGNPLDAEIKTFTDELHEGEAL